MCRAAASGRLSSCARTSAAAYNFPMRRMLILASLVAALALPVYAQRRSMSSGHSGGSAGIRSSRGGFPGHSGVNPRGGFRVRPGVGFGGGVSFGHNPRFNVFVNSRPFHARRYSVFPYRSWRSNVYPYVVYPAYPLSYYDAYDYVSVQPSYAYPAYATPSSAYQYAQGEGTYPDRGLAYQMREEGVGIYKQPTPARPQPAAPQATAPAAPDRELPPALLVYRDGRRAEVRNYAIVGPTLWIFTEERAQKIALTQLDMEATRQANEERGIDFPAAPK
jgi:hypothetical protein